MSDYSNFLFTIIINIIYINNINLIIMIIIC